MADNLFIIEAPGKRQALSEALKGAGLHSVKVMATIGHICGNPLGFRPLAIDSNYQELAYRVKPEKENIAQSICEAARFSKRIYLALDDDQEGDVIARDVVKFCVDEDDRNKVLRVRLRSLALSELTRAVGEASTFDPISASQGDARRIVDRLIGSLSADAVAIGRVQGSTLLELQSKVPIKGVMTYVIPSQDGLEDWTASEAIYAGMDQPSAAYIDADLSVSQCKRTTLETRVMSHNEILLSVSLATGRNPSDVSDALQGLYERGQMTYPRSKNCAITPEAVKRLTAIARSNGASFDASSFSAVRVNEHGHEAPNPLVVGMALNRDLSLLSFDEQVLVLVARGLIKCGISCEQQYPSAEQVQALPGRFRSLRWQRKVNKGIALWKEPIQRGYKAWSPEQSLLHFMSKSDLGRPSTIVKHVETFLRRDLVSDDFELTKKGREWSAEIGRVFGNRNLSQVVEKYLEANSKDHAEMVADLMDLCNLEICLDRQENENEINEIHSGYIP